MSDKTCLFCTEPESMHHLFFECCVVKIMWDLCSNIFGLQLVGGFEAVAKWWISRKKHTVLNTCTSVVLSSIWSLRNAFCFQGKSGWT